jgi:hypothetical protein
MLPPTKFIIFLLCFCLIWHDSFGQQNKIIVKNNHPVKTESTIIEIPLKNINYNSDESTPKAFIVKDNDGISTGYQIVNNYKNSEDYLLLCDESFQMLGKTFSIERGVSKEYENIKYTNCNLAVRENFELKDGIVAGGNFVKRNYVKLPAFHKPQNGYLQYEGIGWESDKIAYRLYLDSRNKIDIFGKTKNEMVLDRVGLYDYIPGKESYQKMQDWGMDIYKVANTYGLASFAVVDDNHSNILSGTDSTTCKILDNGNIFSRFEINYYGAVLNNSRNDFKATISITKGTRLSKVIITARNKFDNITTGLARHTNTETIWSNKENSEWQYIGVYGKQSLANDDLGTALFYKTISAQKVGEDSINETVVLTPFNNEVTYYFCAAWEQEPNGIKNIADFEEYLNEVLNKLNNPLQISYE